MISPCCIFIIRSHFQCIPKERLFITFLLFYCCCRMFSFYLDIYIYIVSNPDMAPPSISSHESLWTEIPYYTIFRFTEILDILPHSIYRHQLRRRTRDSCLAIYVYCIQLSWKAVEADAAQSGYLWSVTWAVLTVFRRNSFPIMMHPHFILTFRKKPLIKFCY
jgi:hypothetical protein